MTTDEKKAAAAEKRRQTYRRKKEWEAQRRADREATITALRAVRDSDETTPSEKLRAVELLKEMYA